MRHSPPSGGLRILLTRPRVQAARVARRLRRAGHSCAIDPIFTVEAVPAAPPPESPQALILTSANAVPAAAAMFAHRKAPPVLAVGPATARAAQRAGLRQVSVAEGTAPSVAEAAKALFRAENGPLLHVCGQETAGDLPGWLGAVGFTVIRRVVYRVAPAATLPPRTTMLLDRDRLDAVMLLSPRTAAAFVALVEAAGRRPALSRLTALCLSANVAAAAGAGWHDIRTAPQPSMEAMLALAAAG